MTLTGTDEVGVFFKLTSLTFFYSFFQFFLDSLSGNSEYVLKICAGTTSQVDSSVIRWGDPSPERRVYLPQNNCKILYPDSGSSGDGGGVAELSAGMIIGAMCAIGFLVLACVGFVVWR